VEVSEEAYRLHAELCRTVGHPTRLRILDSLRNREWTVGELARELGVEQSTLSQHLSVMRRVGLITRRQRNASAYYALHDPSILEPFDAMRRLLVRTLVERQRSVLAVVRGRR
jgi:DNA-binding transcriptional ArsR family regulator